MKNSIIVAARPDQLQDEWTDPETLGLAYHHQGPTFINEHCQAATNLVDCDRSGGNDLPHELGQGGLCSLSTLSSYYY